MCIDVYRMDLGDVDLLIIIAGQAFGLTKCPCIGLAGVDGTAMVLVGEHYVAYPGGWGGDHWGEEPEEISRKICSVNTSFGVAR